MQNRLARLRWQERLQRAGRLPYGVTFLQRPERMQRHGRMQNRCSRLQGPERMQGTRRMQNGLGHGKVGREFVQRSARLRRQRLREQIICRSVVVR